MSTIGKTQQIERSHLALGLQPIAERDQGSLCLSQQSLTLRGSAKESSQLPCRLAGLLVAVGLLIRVEGYGSHRSQGL